MRATLGVFPEPSADVALMLVVEVEVVAPEVVTSVVGALVRWVAVFEGAPVGIMLVALPKPPADVALMLVGEVEVVAPGVVTLVVGVLVG